MRGIDFRFDKEEVEEVLIANGYSNLRIETVWSALGAKDVWFVNAESGHPVEALYAFRDVIKAKLKGLLLA